MSETSTVDPRRIAETLMASHLEDTCGEIPNAVIRAHVDALVYEGLIAAHDADRICGAVDEEMVEAARHHNLKVTITGD